MLEIKKRLKQLRKDHGLTMAEFAQKIAVSPGNVGDWESGSRSSIPGAKALIAIADTFEVSIDWILLGPAASSAPAWSAASSEQAAREEEEALRLLIAELRPRDRRLVLEMARRLRELTSEEP